MDSTPVFAQLVRFFAGQPWRFHEQPERNLVSFDYVGTAATWRTYVTAFEEAQQVAVYGVIPFAIDPAHRVAVAELLTRINFGLVIGNFELDYADGESRYKTSLDFEGAELTDPLLLQLVRSNLSVVDRYLPALVAVAEGRLSVGDALQSLDSSAAALPQS